MWHTIGRFLWRSVWLWASLALLVALYFVWPRGAGQASPLTEAEALGAEAEAADEPFTLFPVKEVEPKLQPMVAEYRQKMKEKNEALLQMEKDNVELRVELDRTKKAHDEIKELTRQLAKAQKDLEEKGYVIPEKMHQENLILAARTVKVLGELEAAADELESGLDQLHASYGRYLAARHLEAFASLRKLKLDRKDLFDKKVEADRIKTEMETSLKRVERGMVVFTYPPEKPQPLVRSEAWARERLLQIRSGMELFSELRKKVEAAKELEQGPTADRLIAEGKFLRAEDLSPDSQRRKREDEKREQLKKDMETLAAEMKDKEKSGKGKEVNHRFTYCRGWPLHRLFVNSHFTVEGQYLPSYDTWRLAVLTGGKKIEPTVANYEDFVRYLEPLRQLGWFSP